VWDLLGAMGSQVVLALVALASPMSFAKTPRTAGISLGFLVRDFAGSSLGIDDGPVTIYTLFIGIALLAGVTASLRSQQFRIGVVAAMWALVIGTAIWSMCVLLLNYALWGSSHWYQFWLQDGAINDVRSSGSHDLAIFPAEAAWIHPWG
jgi:hypothetical protein